MRSTESFVTFVAFCKNRNENEFRFTEGNEENEGIAGPGLKNQDSRNGVSKKMASVLKGT